MKIYSNGTFDLFLLIKKILYYKIFYFLLALCLFFSIFIPISIEDEFKAKCTLQIHQPNKNISDNFTSLNFSLNPFSSDQLGIGHVIKTLESYELLSEIVNDIDKVYLFASKGYDHKNKKLLFDNEIYDQSKELWLRPELKYKTSEPDIEEIKLLFDEINEVKINPEFPNLLEISFQHLDPVFASYMLKKQYTKTNEILRERDLALEERQISNLISELKNQESAMIKSKLSDIISEKIGKVSLIKADNFYVLEPIDKCGVPIYPSYPNRPVLAILIFIFSFFVLFTSLSAYLLYREIND